MTKEELLLEVKKEAEEYFQRGEFFCSEAIVHTINNLLDEPYDREIVELASGFPIGMGKAGCLCGAVSGGQMAFGMVYGRVHGEAMNEKMFPVAKELHDFTKEQYGSNCWRVITREWKVDNFMSPERKAHCAEITGRIAAWVAGKLIEDGQIELKEKASI